MMRLPLLVLLILAAMLTGCAELQQQFPALESAPACKEPAGGANHWLAEIGGTRDQSPDHQQQTLEEWEQAFQASPNIDNRMRLVLLLATGADTVRDPRRAHRLLNGIDPLPAGAGDRELISLLLLWLDDQSESARKLDILWKQVTTQNRRVEELEQQLQALTTIEQNIQNRDIPPTDEQ
jgi:hypothetical protein